MDCKKILLISDTHSNFKILEDVLSYNQNCEYLIHLGDDPNDLDYFTKLTENMNIFYVYGLYHDKWKPENSVVKFSIHGQDFCISHAKEFLLKMKDNCIYCYGHTHKRDFYAHNKIVLINPGHLKNTIDRGEIASYVIINLKKKIEFNFFDINHQLIEVKMI